MHKWKVAFIKEMKKKIPSYNGSLNEVDRVVENMIMIGKTPQEAAKIMFERYQKMKNDPRGKPLYKNLLSKPGAFPRTQAAKERQNLVKESRQMASTMR